MRIGATFIHPDGSDWTGLDPLPTINIYDLSDNSLVINAAAMSEVAKGGYKYTFAAYDPSKDYYWHIDAGVAVPTHLRYRRGWTGLAGAIPDAQAGTSGGLPTVGASNRIAGIQGTKNTLDDLNDLSAAEVNAEVVDTLNVDTYPEPGRGAPPEEATIVEKVGFPYKFWRNKNTRSTADGLEIYNNAGTEVDQKATISDDGTTFTKGKYESGP